MPVPPHPHKTIGLNQAYFSEAAAFQKCFLHLSKNRVAAALCVHLDHAVVFARRRDHRLTLHHIDTDGFLHKHIRPRLHRRDRRHRMPVVGCRDDHDVGHIGREHITVVCKRARHMRLALGHEVQSFAQLFGAHITQRRHAPTGIFDQTVEVHSAIPAAANEADRGRLHGISTKQARGRSGNRTCGRESGNKGTTIHGEESN